MDEKKLTRDQERALTAAVKRHEPLAISAMTLLEIAILVSRHKLKLPLIEFLADLASNPVIRILPLTPEVALEVSFLDILVDPADKTIVATARIHRLTLLTSDERILESALVKTLG